MESVHRSFKAFLTDHDTAAYQRVHEDVKRRFQAISLSVRGIEDDLRQQGAVDVADCLRAIQLLEKDKLMEVSLACARVCFCAHARGWQTLKLYAVHNQYIVERKEKRATCDDHSHGHGHSHSHAHEQTATTPADVEDPAYTRAHREARARIGGELSSLRFA